MGGEEFMVFYCYEHLRFFSNLSRYVIGAEEMVDDNSLTGIVIRGLILEKLPCFSFPFFAEYPRGGGNNLNP